MDAQTTQLARLSAHTENLASRVQALQQVLALVEGRVDRTTIAKVRDVLRRAGQRTAISGEKTVVALVGPTGAGKSSLFNALTGKHFAEVAVRRPTTSEARAVVWGEKLPEKLLDWLEIGKRHLLESDDPELNDLVLIDMPDYDSVEDKHRETVDRLVKVVDALIWVVDPEKYADAALHEGYLKPLSEYAEVMMVAFNKADVLSEADMNRCVRDMRRLLNDNQLNATRIVVTAVAFNTGVPSLLDMVKRTVAAKVAMTARLSRDISVAAYSIEIELGKTTPVVNRRQVAELAEAVSDVAGVGEKTAAIEQEWLTRGQAVTGWPFVAKRYRRASDPLRRVKASQKVQLDLTEEEGPISFQGAVGRAKVKEALRTFAERLGDGLPSGWKRAVSTAANRELNQLMAQLADIAVQKTPPLADLGWWNAFRALKIVCMLGVVFGLGWLLASPVLSEFGYPALPPLTWLAIPAPLWLIVPGLVVGVLSGLLGRLLVRPTARNQAKLARNLLIEQVEAVVKARAVDPVQAELNRIAESQTLVRRALR
ncbi:MAG: 50S ribosome-binding GTPase [Propionibacteriaceae bacterium]|jgi:GTP-binding protein EngB required for normal cell division|nr:50S ribosome-binding GTPase [Propionibacteriaceae bacterium]